MISGVAGQLQAEVRLHRRTDVRRATFKNAPSTVLILMAKDPVRSFLESLLSSGSQKSVQTDVTGLKAGIGFEFSAPIPFLMLLGEKIIPRRCDRRADPAAQFLYFSETNLG